MNALIVTALSLIPLTTLLLALWSSATTPGWRDQLYRRWAVASSNRYLSGHDRRRGHVLRRQNGRLGGRPMASGSW